MSHTTHLDVSAAPGIQKAWVVHNADWSGNARVCWTTGCETGCHEVVLPGRLLTHAFQQLAIAFVQGVVVEALEDLSPDSTIAGTNGTEL